MQANIHDITKYFLGLQEIICETLQEVDGQAEFSIEQFNPENGGLSQPRILDSGRHIERGAVQFSHSIGDRLPPAATERNPDLAGKGFEAAAISMIMHPCNPYVPTMHANLRFFIVEESTWHFGGGFDLTPYYGFEEDAVHWHHQANLACQEFGESVYEECKKKCDDYFYLSHRNEPRGIGGLFFDDWTRGGFENSFAFTRSVGDHILPAYLPILQKRKDIPFGERERDFQLYRRGRYAEFNLAIDRGTRYGLQSGRRIESVLASMPPLAKWRYNWKPDPGSPEARLYEIFLKPQDWLNWKVSSKTW
ncbi:MAG: oxygen-dependent coproporphyrinogen oxidase [SAR324 cluster bacterium]|nr:oxygen-dependent coproporphyrinogen oxidase [SAR324 cluster bacterium]